MTFKFEPWESALKECPRKEPHLLDIEEPPCKHCKYWSPQTIYYSNREGLYFDSVRLCWYENTMCPDFSCYEEKEDDNSSN